MNLYKRRLPRNVKTFPCRPSTRSTNTQGRTENVECATSSGLFAMTEKKEQTQKVSVVVTAKNDDLGIRLLRKDLAKQTRKPHEIIIIRAEDYNNCTRAEGRNIGIKKAKYNSIAVTDVGCRPHKDWLEKLLEKVQKSTKSTRKYKKGARKKIEWVIAGGYRVIAKTPFQQAIAPYLATSQEKLGERYLPASRSIAFTKEAWKKVGGYPEEAKSAGEDLEFARRLSVAPGVRIEQVPAALVDWEPPKTLEQYFLTICDHTRGNFEARITPHIIRNLTVPLRWILLFLVPQLLVLYLLWPIGKHGRQLTSKGQTLSTQGLTLFLLPVIQLVTDCGIILGMLQFYLPSIRLPRSSDNVSRLAERPAEPDLASPEDPAPQDNDNSTEHV